ncbi:MAG: hypothetical protein DI586_05250 [Micavibrio aeruginosavorus]|uniref:Uncharacterized protein n=1 Tax=Micavibrio aeruginosavorus TaxID=349221 RepID=A0A2W5FQ55_9BACT|nr:MAG: hypothetical protein DI586_05250 [Micavibrio aeruginosavorus]
MTKNNNIPANDSFTGSAQQNDGVEKATSGSVTDQILERFYCALENTEGLADVAKRFRDSAVSQKKDFVKIILGETQ